MEFGSRRKIPFEKISFEKLVDEIVNFHGKYPLEMGIRIIDLGSDSTGSSRIQRVYSLSQFKSIDEVEIDGRDFSQYVKQAADYLGMRADLGVKILESDSSCGKFLIGPEFLDHDFAFGANVEKELSGREIKGPLEGSCLEEKYSYLNLPKKELMFLIESEGISGGEFSRMRYLLASFRPKVYGKGTERDVWRYCANDKVSRIFNSKREALIRRGTRD